MSTSASVWVTQCEDGWPSARRGTPCLGPPGRRRTPGLWRWAARRGFCRCQRSSPCPAAGAPAGTPLRLPLEAYSTRTYRGPATQHGVTFRSQLIIMLIISQRCAAASPSCVHAPSRLMMFLCFPIIFIISISDTRSDKSLSVASSETNKREWRPIRTNGEVS